MLDAASAENIHAVGESSSPRRHQELCTWDVRVPGAVEKGPGAQALTDAEPLILGEANTLFPPQNRVNNVVVILW